eukprot:m.470697 g.470697  ORF g.470697 m.470697 type:complete len:572 (+) comp21653_c0_seq1:232-1947(+)
MLARTTPSFCRPELNAPGSPRAPGAPVRAFAAMHNNHPNRGIHQNRRRSSDRKCAPVLAGASLRDIPENSENDGMSGGSGMCSPSTSPPTSPLSPIVQNVCRNNNSTKFTMSPKKHRRLTPIVPLSAFRETSETQDRLCNMQRVPKLAGSDIPPKNVYMVAALLSQHMSLEELDLQIEAEQETIELLHRVKARKRALQQSHSSLGRLVEQSDGNDTALDQEQKFTHVSIPTSPLHKRGSRRLSSLRRSVGHSTLEQITEEVDTDNTPSPLSQLSNARCPQQTPPSSLSRSLFHVVTSNLDSIAEVSSPELSSPPTPEPNAPSALACCSPVQDGVSKYFQNYGAEVPPLPVCDYPLDTSDESDDGLADDESDGELIAHNACATFKSDFVRIIQLPCLEDPAAVDGCATAVVSPPGDGTTETEESPGVTPRRQWCITAPADVLGLIATATTAGNVDDFPASDLDDECYNVGYFDTVTPLVAPVDDMPGIIEAASPLQKRSPPARGHRSKRVRSLSYAAVPNTVILADVTKDASNTDVVDDEPGTPTRKRSSLLRPEAFEWDQDAVCSPQKAMR